ncbi:SPG20 [Mytilus coruscus]|uniref:SPG20 n=1 Tax=Mytilus coruscus TaxID=42192 RepID=A0A6J8BCA7_MYTCO|nr:SPG20 [Mytilus coruscus]
MGRTLHVKNVVILIEKTINMASYQTDYKTIQSYHDNAYKHIEKGLSADESENFDEAVNQYRAGLQFLDKGLAIDCEKLKATEEKKDSAKLLQQKMTKTKLQIEYRLQSIEVQRNVHSRHPTTPMDLNQPPSYEDVMSESGSSIRSAVGLMLPDTMSSTDKDAFESVLSSMTMMQDQEVVAECREPTAPPEEMEVIPSEGETKEDESTSAKISKGIAVASSWITWGIEKGAEKAGHYIKVGSEKIKEKLKPEEKAKDIDPRVIQGVQYVRRGTHTAVKVSSYVVKKLGEATMAVGREIAPHIKKHGEKLLPESVKGKSSDGKSKVDGVIDVAGAGLKGFSAVYLTLEAAAKALGRNITNETVTLVDYKYGSQAGLLAEHGMYAVGNTVLTVNNVDNLGIKAVAKRTAKETGKALIMDINEERKTKPTDSRVITQTKKS